MIMVSGQHWYTCVCNYVDESGVSVQHRSCVGDQVTSGELTRYCPDKVSLTHPSLSNSSSKLHSQGRN